MTTAGFRFIPIEPDVVDPPLALDAVDLGTPFKGGVSGSLDITWVAETPVCVGQEGDEPRTVVPIRIGGEVALPGASLRGMIRAVAEIATFSHLGHINADRHYGVRDYDFNRMPEAHKHRPVRPRSSRDGSEPERFLRAGWLRYDGARWQLSRCQTPRRGYDEGFWLVHFQQLLDQMTRRGHPPRRPISGGNSPLPKNMKNS